MRSDDDLRFGDVQGSSGGSRDLNATMDTVIELGIQGFKLVIILYVLYEVVNILVF